MRRAVPGLMFLFFAVAPAFATDYYADVLGGPWTSSSTWHLISNSGPAAPAGTYPGSAAGDKAIIDFQGITITLNTTVPNAVTLDANNVSCFVVVNAGAMLPLTGASQIAGGTILQLTGGTIDNAGTLDIRSNSGFTWSGGTLTGSGSTNLAFDVTLPALLTLSGGILDAHTLNVNGKVTYTGSWVMNNGAQVNISSTGSFDVQTLGAITTNSAATADINNSGIFKKTAGGGGTNIDVPVNNNATVDVTAGVLVLGGSPTHTNGTFSIASGCAIEFHGTFTGTNNVTGLGTANIVGTPVIDNGATVNFTNISMNGGWIQGPAAGSGIANVSGTVTFNGGVWQRNLTVNLLGTSITNIVGGAGAFIHDASVVNDGAFNINSGVGTLGINTGGNIQNNTTISLIGDVTVDSDSVNNARIDNKSGASILKTTGAGTAIVKVILNNDGIVQSDSGNIQFTKSGVHTGTFKICDACIFDFAAGNHTLDGALIQYINLAGGAIAKLSGATLDIPTNAQISTNHQFIHTAGTITGDGSLSIFAAYLWGGGTQSGAGDTQLATYNHVFDGAFSAMNINGRDFNVNGTIDYSPVGANVLSINSGAVVTISSAILNLTTDAAINSDGTGVISNENSTVNKSGGAGKAVIQAIFNNLSPILVSSRRLTPNGLFFGASLNITSGQVALNGGGSNEANIFVPNAANAVIFESNTFTLNVGTNTNPADLGLFRVNGGTLTLGTALTLTNVELLAGTINGADLNISRKLGWKGGTLLGPGNTTIDATATLAHLAPTLPTFLDNRTLHNDGIVEYEGNGLTLTNNAVINNNAGAEFRFFGGVIGNGSGTNVFNNAGTVRKTTIASSAFESQFNNDGAVDVQAGALTCSFGTHTGSFTAADGMTLSFIGASNTFGPTSSITGSGNVRFNGDFNTFSGTYTLTGNGSTVIEGSVVTFNSAASTPNLGMGGGTLTGSGAFDITGGTGSFWAGGTISGTGAFNIAAGVMFDMQVNLFGPMTLDGRTITNNGDIRYSPPSALTLTNGASIDNNGTFDIQNNTALDMSGATTFINDGTFTKSAGGGTTSFGPAFTNNNIVTLANGDVAFNGGFTQNGGTTTLAGGNLSSTLVDLNAGVLAGNGTITGNVDNGAAINPGASAGSLTIAGNYTQSGTLNVEIGGTSPGVSYDQLIVTGTATLGGTMNATLIGGYVPSGGETFDPVTFASSSGTFGSEFLPAFAGGSFVSAYLPTSYQLAAITAQADVMATQTTSGPALHGQNATFTITIQNLGPDTAGGVALSDTLTGGTIVSATSTAGSCTTSPISCNIGVLASGDSAVVTLVVNADTVGTITNSASVSVSGGTIDPNTGNNATGPATITVSEAADLHVIKTGPGSASSGDTIVYTIMVKNTGPDTAVNVVVNEPTPAGLDFQSNSGACTTAFPCSLGNMANGETKTITSTYFVNPSASGSSVVNSVTVSSSTGDPISGNNSSSVATTIDCPLAVPAGLAPTGSAPIDGVLTWSDAGADSYVVFLGVAGSGCATLVGTTFTTSLPYSGLTPNTMYEWRVLALFGSCATTSACVTFTTETECTTVGAPLARVVGQNTTGKDYDVEFDAVDGATHYTIEEATNDAFTDATITTVPAVQLSASFTHDVAAPTAYFYRVRAFNDCTPAGGPYSPVIRVVIIPIAPPSNNPNTSVPVGTDELIVQQVFIPGEPGQTLFFTATTDQPWLTVQPPSGVLPPEGVILNAVADPSELPNGTFTATVIVTVSDTSAVRTNPTATVSVPVSVSLVTPITPVSSKGSTSPHAVIIPAVGHNEGIDSHWQSDVRVTNAGFRAYRYRLTFTPTGGTSLGVKQTEIRVDAGFTTALDDIVRNWYGFGSLGDGTTGMLEIVPTEDVENAAKAMVVTSRTYNVQEKGTLGQFIPAIPFANFIGAAAGNALPPILSLQQIAQNNIFRTNVGIAEASGVSANALVSIFNAAGTKLIDIPVQLAGGQQIQMNALLAQHDIALDDGRIEVKVAGGGGKITAYASVIDNGTGDPLLVDGILLQQSGATRYVLPGATSIDTGFANWLTDMRVFNYGSAPQPATLTFFPLNNGTPRVAQIIANPNEVLALDNVVKSLFAGENIGGAVHVDTPSPSSLVVTARTYNVTSAGTLGQFISAVTPSQAIGANEGSLYIPQVEDSVRYRTNIGVAETTGQETVIELQVKLPDAKITPVVTLTLAPNEFRQLALIRELQLGNVYNGLVTVRVVRGGRVTAYGSVIDEATGDPTFVPPQKTR
ncbi:MAG TPA: hypothetical protein VNA69_14925 [Thermoanaerobaculia bacterium]|nr:hypothetical protein [Thermoanaerobaculia bacterium]